MRLIFSPNVSTDHYSVDVSRDGKMMALGHKHDIKIYDVFSLKILHTFVCPESIERLSFSPSREFIAAIVNDCGSIILIFNISSSQLFATVTGNENDVIPPGDGTLQWSPKSTFLFASWKSQIGITMYKVCEKRLYFLKGVKLDSDQQPLCSFSPDEDYFVEVERTVPSTIVVYSTNNWIILKRIICEDFEEIDGLKWFQNATQYIIWNSLGSLKFQAWSLDGRLEHTLQSSPLEFGIRQLAVSPLGRLIAIMQYGTMKTNVYDSLTWQLPTTLNHSEMLSSCLKGIKITEEKVLIENKKEETSGQNYHWQAYVAENQDPYKFVIKQSIGSSTSTQSPRLIQFSSCGKFIATYEPDIPGILWIWNFTFHLLIHTIIKFSFDHNGTSPVLPDLNWHPSQPYLSANFGKETLIWDQKLKTVYYVRHTSGFYTKNVWCNTASSLLIAFTTDESTSIAFRTVHEKNKS